MGSSKKIIEMLVFVLVGLSPLLMGSVHLSVALIFLTLLFPMFLFQAKKGNLRRTEFALVAAFMAALSVLQLIPLPTSLPFHNMKMFKEGAVLLGELPAWRPLSLEPFLTADRGIRFFVIALLIALVASLSSRRFYRRAIFSTLVSGWVVFGVGVFLWLSESTTLFGFEQTLPFRAPSSFVNTNHGATYFSLITIASLAYFKLGKHRIFGAISATTFFILMLIHGSIGTLILFTITILFWVSFNLKPQKLPRFFASIFVLISGVLFLIWLEIVPGEDFIRALFTQSSTRLELTQGGLKMARDAFLFGTGLGSTDTAILPYLNWDHMRPASIPTLENEFLEIFGTAGIVGGLVFLGGHFFLLLRATKAAFSKNTQRKTRWHFLVLLLFIGITALHFPWFTLGISFPFVLLIEGTRPSERLLKVPLIVIISIVFLGVLLSSLIFWEGREDTFARPLFSEPWITEATHALREGNNKRALTLAEHASKLDPRPKTIHYLARVVAKNGDQNRAIQLYQFAFKNGLLRSQMIADMLTDLPDAASQNLVLQVTDAPTWKRAAEISFVHFGAGNAIALAFDAIEKKIFIKSAQGFAVQVFIDLDQPELARMWTETHQVDESLLTAIYLQQKEYDAFYAMVAINPSNLPTEFILRRYRSILKTGDRGDRLIRELKEEYCMLPVEGSRQVLCWEVAAFLALKSEAWPKAEVLYQRILNRTLDARPLAEYYSRRGQCTKLKKLVNIERKYKQRLELLLSKCTKKYD